MFQYVIRAGQVVCMDDYEKEFYMVQGFAAASGSVPGPPGSLLSGPPSSEFVQDGQQGIVVLILWNLFAILTRAPCGADTLIATMSFC